MRRAAPRQRGIAAVELAIVMPVLVLLLAFPLALGRIFWHYTAFQYAAQDAARYLSKVPVSEMGNPTRGGEVARVAQAMVAQELAELAPGPVGYVLDVYCISESDSDGGSCAGEVPTAVRVKIKVYFADIFFADYTGLNLWLTVNVAYPYLGK